MQARGAEYGVLHLKSSREEMLSSFLQTYAALSATRVRELVSLGSIYVNGDRQIDDLKLKIGDDVRVHSEPRRFSVPELKSRIVDQTSDYIIIDKPSGLPVHALTDNRRENLISALQSQIDENLFVTHRIDIETSGLLLLAKSKEVQGKINALIREGKVARFYHAWTLSALACQRYVGYMMPSPKAPKVISSTPQDGWDECVLHVRACEPVSGLSINDLEFEGSAYRLEIELETGRTQQIRAQLSSLGAPIINDVGYGGADLNSERRAIALRAFRLVLDGKQIQIP